MKSKTMVLLLLVALLPAAAAAEPPEGLETGPIEYFDMLDSPVSGPVETFVNSSFPTASRGGFTEVFLVVQNHSNESTVSINIELDLRYADGVAVRPFHLGQDRAHILGPDQGVGFRVFFAVPADAPLGQATFRVNARVGRVSGGEGEGHKDNTNPMVASDSVQFEVVP